MQPTFKEIKKLALRRTNKSYGRCIRGDYRLWYDKQTEQVHLMQRKYYNQEIIFTAYSDDSICIKGTHLYQSEYSKINEFCGVYMQVIPSGNKNRNKHLGIEYNIICSGGKATYIYVPEETWVKNGEVIRIGPYKTESYEPKWNKDFISRNRKFLREAKVLIQFAEQDEKDIDYYTYSKPEDIIRDAIYSENYDNRNLYFIKRVTSSRGAVRKEELVKFVARYKKEVARLCNGTMIERIHQTIQK